MRIDVAALATQLDRALAQVASLQTLASSLAEGLRVGVVDPDHLALLITAQAEGIEARLQAAAAAAEAIALATAGSSSTSG